jgi:hypothetical protein
VERVVAVLLAVAEVTHLMRLVAPQPQMVVLVAMEFLKAVLVSQLQEPYQVPMVVVVVEF